MNGINVENGNVVSMSGFRGESGYSALNMVEAYWHGLRRGGGVPRRSDIDPRGIENALEYAFILERIAPGMARLRIAGMHLSDLMGMEVRGMPVASFLPPAARTGFSDMLEQVMAGPAVAKLKLSAETGIGKPPLEGRMILLPLVSDFGDISRVLGCFETRGQIGRAPRRFNVTETALIPVEGATKPETPVSAPTLNSLQGFAEAPSTFRSARAGEREKWPEYLRLVKSDD